ncbi:MAG: hypothetical protein IJ725_01685, partial [Ruminococcus sp.]|nr:hypothetical protein [Ruminococcus sp.]
ANTMFSALSLTKGEHKIKLTYSTPAFKIGIMLSALGCAAFIGFVVFTVVRRKKSGRVKK